MAPFTRLGFNSERSRVQFRFCRFIVAGIDDNDDNAVADDIDVTQGGFIVVDAVVADDVDGARDTFGVCVLSTDFAQDPLSQIWSWRFRSTIILFNEL